MRITVQLSGDAAQSLRARAPATPESQALWATANGLGISLEPLHPDSDDPTLRTYFTVDVPDGAAAQHVIDHLRQNPAVSAAYVKPPDAMP
jgi:hypothetical protein